MNYGIQQCAINYVELTWKKYQPIAINRKQDKNNREVTKMSETFKYKVSSERLSEDSFKMKKIF